MMGLERMIASMTGISPEEMKQKVSEFEGFVRGGSQALESIAETQKLILAKLEALENGRTAS